jgi:hypothetical protein
MILGNILIFTGMPYGFPMFIVLTIIGLAWLILGTAWIVKKAT